MGSRGPFKPLGPPGPWVPLGPLWARIGDDLNPWVQKHWSQTQSQDIGRLGISDPRCLVTRTGLGEPWASALGLEFAETFWLLDSTPNPKVSFLKMVSPEGDSPSQGKLVDTGMPEHHQPQPSAHQPWPPTPPAPAGVPI